MSDKPKTIDNTAGAVAPGAPCSSSFTEGPWRYQKETTVTILGKKVPPRVRYQIYKDGGIYGHPATCDREKDARLIVATPNLLALAEKLAAWDKRWPKWSDSNGTSEKEMNALCEEAHAILESLRQNDKAIEGGNL